MLSRLILAFAGLSVFAFGNMANVVLPLHGPILGKVVKADLTLNQPLKQDVTNYLGLPYAKPPVGALRFRSPQKYEGTWVEPRNFTATAKDCMSGTKGSEDCLYLNVFVPASASTSKPLPVMFWIYGGGFTFGRVAMYNGTALASQEDVIVVVPSYRFGPLGFFANAATLAESGSTGNWGILDQRMALQWVNDNIEYFGGDKKSITIFGESAGGISVATHMVSPGSQGLFHKAIIQSAVLDLDLFYLKQEDSFKFYDWMAKDLNYCANGEDMECLRRIPATRFAMPESLRDSPKAPTWAASMFPFFPVGLTIDNSVVFGSPLEMALQGKTAKVPLIIGLTQDEGTIFAIASPSIVRPKPQIPPTEDDVKRTLKYFMGNEDFVNRRFAEEFHYHRDKYPDIESLEGTSKWDADKKVHLDAYRAIHVDPSRYIDVSDIVARKKAAERANPVYGKAKIKQMMENLAREFFSRDLANESFESIVNSSPEIAEMYERSKGGEGRPVVKMYDRAPMSFLTAAARDVIFGCPALQFAGAHRDLGNKVFFYNLAFDVWKGSIFYNVDVKGATGKPGEIAVADLGVFHGADIPLVFKMFKSQPTHPADIGLFSLFNLFIGNQLSQPGDKAHQVADLIGCYWANLAKCGDAHCGQATCHGQRLPVWNHLEAGEHSFMNIGPDGEFEVKTHQQKGYAGVGASLPSNDQCAAWHGADFNYLNIRFNNHLMRLHEHVV